MPTLEIIGLLLLAAAVWLWLDSLKTREIGIRAGRAACAAEDLLFLDDTVAIESIRPVRDEDGRIKLRRVYNFEYSDTGDNRRKGNVMLLGHQVVMFHIETPLPRGDLTLH
jgi:hypothetical protein